MNKKEKNIVVFVCLIILFSVINAVIVFEVHLKNIESNVMTNAEKVVYLTVVIEKYTYYSMFWLGMFTAAFVFIVKGRNKKA
jgi:hypothetical protein